MQFSDYPPEAAKVTDIGATYEALNTELIVSLKPDLILATEINAPEQVKTLEDLGLTVYYMNNPTTIEEMYGDMELVAQLTGHEVRSRHCDRIAKEACCCSGREDHAAQFTLQRFL